MMRYLNKKTLLASLTLSAGIVFAGNPQRAGSAGAAELLINPWARSAGWGGVNVANARGMEATFVNIAGIAHTEGTDVSFSNTQWLVGGGININAAGFNTKVSANGVMTVNFVAFDYGSWERTTEFSPEGNLGTISPSAAIIGAGYSQTFAKSIRGGVNLKIYNMAMVDMSVIAANVDAGVQYVAGDREQLKFGITLRNIGPASGFSGEGQALTLAVPQGGFTQAYNQRSEVFELPTTLALGGSYDFAFDQQRLTVAAAFQSNSFEKDVYTLGAEYSFKDVLSLRSGYTIFDNRDYAVETTVFTGLNAGLSFDVPLSKDNDQVFTLDYSFRATRRFNGVHAIGVSLRL